MPLVLNQPPAEEPISLDDAKAFARIDTSADDFLVQALIVSARMHIEALTRRLMVTQGWTFVADGVPAGGHLTLPAVPVQGISEVRCFDADNVMSVLDPSRWSADLTASPVRIRVHGALPSLRAMAGLHVVFTAGYGAPADVPEALRQAIRILVATWYEERTFSPIGAEAGPLPRAAAALLEPYRVRGL